MSWKKNGAYNFEVKVFVILLNDLEVKESEF